MSATSERAAWLERSRATWNERADGWNSMHDALPADRGGELLRVLDALDIQPGTRLLDAGCGPGQWAVFFAEAGAQVTAIDLAPAMLAHAARRADDAGVTLELREGDILDSISADPEGRYDVIHCRCVLQFAPDLAAVLHGLQRVLAPGGSLLAAVPGSLSPIYSESFRRFLEPTTNNLVNPVELERLLDELGWEVRDGWGCYSAAGSGEPNAFSEPDVLALPRRLQQAAATYWVTIATRR